MAQTVDSIAPTKRAKATHSVAVTDLQLDKPDPPPAARVSACPHVTSRGPDIHRFVKIMTDTEKEHGPVDGKITSTNP